MDFIIALITGFIALVAIVLAMEYYHKWQRARKANTELIWQILEQKEKQIQLIDDIRDWLMTHADHYGVDEHWVDTTSMDDALMKYLKAHNESTL